MAIKTFQQWLEGRIVPPGRKAYEMYADDVTKDVYAFIDEVHAVLNNKTLKNSADRKREGVEMTKLLDHALRQRPEHRVTLEALKVEVGMQIFGLDPASFRRLTQDEEAPTEQGGRLGVIATSFRKDGAEFSPTLRQRAGSAIVWLGMRLILERRPTSAFFRSRNGHAHLLKWRKS